ncbi:MAG: zinc ribbon domain-containing protein [Candidatus Hodarchaeales archaeon]|jgi:hypothetical protein
MAKFCTSCGKALRVNAKFCSSCGKGVRKTSSSVSQSPSRPSPQSQRGQVAQQPSSRAYSDSRQSYRSSTKYSSRKEPIKATGTLNDLRVVEKAIEILEIDKYKEERVQSRIETIEASISEKTNQLSVIENLLEKEYNDVSKLKNSSWDSIKGDLGIDSSKVDLVHIINLQYDVSRLIMIEKEKLEEEKRNITAFEQNKMKLVEMQEKKNKIKNGLFSSLLTNEVLNKFENDLEKLQIKENHLKCDISDIESSLDYLRQSDTYLNQVSNEIYSAAFSVSNMFGGDKINDMIESGQVKRAKSTIIDVQFNVSLAQRYLESITQINTDIELPAYYFDVFLDEILSDWITENRITVSRKNVEKTLTIIRSTIQQLEQMRNTLNTESARIKTVLKQYNEELYEIRQEILMKGTVRPRKIDYYPSDSNIVKSLDISPKTQIQIKFNIINVQGTKNRPLI